MKKNQNTGWKDIFEKEANKAGILLTDKKIGLFEKYLILLEEWNKKINITSIIKREDVAIKHFLDSLLVLKHTAIYGKIADIGSGGGFPGIPLKIINPSLEIFLIEPIRKRASFLKTVISSLNLKNIFVQNERVENFKKKEIFNFTISRALSDIKTFTLFSVPILKPGGFLIAMKGPETEAEIRETIELKINIKFVKEKEFDLPLKTGSRSIVVFQKCFT